MPKILVADDEAVIRRLLEHILTEAGHEVICAHDGRAALVMAQSEHPDLILLDVAMPAVDGFEVLRNLRRYPQTRTTVVMVSGNPGIEGQLAAWHLGVRHYITKPFSPDQVGLAVRVALREAEPAQGSGPGFVGGTAREHIGQDVIRTGLQPLNAILGGGLRLGSLTVIEGPASTGRSLLSQKITYEALLDGHAVTYLTSAGTVEGVLTQMGSIGPDVLPYVQSEHLRIVPYDEPDIDDPECSLGLLADEIGDPTAGARVVVVDEIPSAAAFCKDRVVLAFFYACKRVCALGYTIVVAAKDDMFDRDLAIRLRELWDIHIRLYPVTALKVLRAQNRELHADNMLVLESRWGVGLQPIQMAEAEK